MSELKKTRTHMVNAKLIGSLSSRDELEAVGVHNLKIDGQDVSFEVHGEIDRALKVLAKYEVIELDSRELSLEEVFFSEVES
jgi:collagenase-like PrtC family protease